MSGRLPFAPAFDHLVYVRVFEGCNLHCEHCFIPSNPKKMGKDDLAAIPEQLTKFAPKGSNILLQWHGGEPTIFGAEWLAEAIDTVEAAGGDYQWQHGIQTNLMTYGDPWIPVYKKYFGGEVGVSWDPKIRLLRANDRQSNEVYESRFWNNFERLLADGLDPYMVVTFTRTFVEHFRDPYRFFQMMEERGVRRVHLERVTKTGYARENWDRVGLNNAEYSAAMNRFMRAYWRYCETREQVEASDRLHVSPLDGLIQSINRLQAGEAGGYGCWSGSCDTKFHTIDANGYKAGCTAVTSEIDNKRATEILAFGDYEQARAERQWDCQTCQFRKVCSSGCLASLYDDGSGECSGGQRLFQQTWDLVAAPSHEDVA
ncbi:MAG: 4Fe-4S cluster-binding domain-containing protein [Alphaproteobacteria bacterium]|nr:4Fe-4S cluster-binding domain-containing protein [Alphaproteobacteria bacterium SS10]